MNRNEDTCDDRTVTSPTVAMGRVEGPGRATLTGRRVAHYEVGERLGAGGMGEVYRARDLALGRDAALKVLPAGFSLALRERLLREAWASAKLQHPSIATFYEAGEQDGAAWIAMEFVEGRTLRARLRDGPIPIAEALSLTVQLLEALVHAHAAGILHRDIKPENIMITGDGRAKLLDFGLAKHLGAGGVRAGAVTARAARIVEPDDSDATVTRGAGLSEDSVTMVGAVLGTYGYMSPEQLEGEAVDARTDLFLIGVVLFEMLSGRRAFEGATMKERRAALQSREGPSLDGLDLPAGLAGVVRRSLERGPADRYQTAEEFLSDLRGLDVGERADGATVDAKEEAEEWFRRGCEEYDRSAKGSFDHAGEYFQRVIALNPGHVRSLTRLAGIASMRFTYSTDPKALDEGEAYARRAMKLAPDDGDARAWIGYCLFRRDQATEAAIETLRAMELDPSSSIAVYFAATIFNASMSQREAAGLHERVVGRACDAPHLWRRRETVRLYHRAIELTPRYGWAWLGLGNGYLELSRFDEAERCLLRAIELAREGANSPSGVAGYLGECKRREGKLQEARRYCLAGLDDAESDDMIYRDTIRGLCLTALGRTALEQGDTPAAQAAFRQAVLQLRGRSRALGAGHVLVQALAGSSQAGEAAGPFEEAMRLFQTREGFNFSHFWLCRNDTTLLELARTARALGRSEEAKKLFADALDYGSTEAANEAAAGLWK